MRHNKRVMTVLDLSDQVRKPDPEPEFIAPPKWDKARILPDLTTEAIVANPSPPPSPYFPESKPLSAMRKYELEAFMDALDSPATMPDPDPAKPPMQTQSFRDVFPAGAQRLKWTRPIKRGMGPKKLFSKDTPHSVRYHDSYRDAPEAPDVFTKAPKRAHQVRIYPDDVERLNHAGVILIDATREQIAGPTFPPFLVVISDRNTSGVGRKAVALPRFYTAKRLVDGKRREITHAQFLLALGR